MIFTIFSMAFAAIASAQVPASNLPQSLVAEHCNFGELYQFQSATCRFKLRNIGHKAIRVSGISPSSPGDSVSVKELLIPPQEALEVEFSTNVEDKLGELVKFVTLVVDGEPRRMIASGFVVSDLDDATATLDYGVVDASLGTSFRSITLSSRAVPEFKIEKILDVPEWIEARVDRDGRTVSARVKAGAPWVPSQGKLKLAINTPRQKQAWITVDANLQGSVIPSSNPYEVGAVHEGKPIEFLVRLNTRAKEALRLGKISVEGARAEVSSEACINKSSDCQQLRVTIPEDMPRGLFRGVIFVELPEHKRTLPITFGGLIVAKTTEIRKMPDSVDGSSLSSEITAASPAVNLSGLLKSSVSQSRGQTTTPSGTGPLLRWQVAHEQQIYGYLIQRSDDKAGPFVRINSDIIRTASSGEGWSYQWRDSTAVSGKSYWYYISVVDKNGRVQQLSEPQKITAK